MAEKPSLGKLIREFDSLLPPVKEERLSDISDSEGEESVVDLRTLRSGKKYSNISFPSTSSTPSPTPPDDSPVMPDPVNPSTSVTPSTNTSTVNTSAVSSPPAGDPTQTGASAGSTSQQSAQQLLQPQSLASMSHTIKVLPQACSVAEFSGENPEYPARDFITRCENAIRNSCITDAADKIAFICSRLQASSRAHRLMQSSTFLDPIEAGNYDQFKVRLLETFGDYARKSVVKGVAAVCERLETAVSGKDELDAQIIASTATRDILRLLDDNSYFVSDQMSRQDAKSFIEFFTYMLVLQSKKRKVALPLEFKKQDCLHDFCNKLKTKLEETGNKAQMAVANLAATISASPEPKPLLKTPPWMIQGLFLLLHPPLTISCCLLKSSVMMFSMPSLA